VSAGEEIIMLPGIKQSIFPSKKCWDYLPLNTRNMEISMNETQKSCFIKYSRKTTLIIHVTAGLNMCFWFVNGNSPRSCS